MTDAIVRPVRENEPAKIVRIYKRCGLHQNYLPPGETHVAVVEGKLIGAVTVDGNTIYCLCVTPKYRRGHIGSQLMQFAEDTIRANFDDCRLGVKMRNWNAIRMYWKRGYRIIGIHERSFRMVLSSKSRWDFLRTYVHRPVFHNPIRLLQNHIRKQYKRLQKRLQEQLRMRLQVIYHQRVLKVPFLLDHLYTVQVPKDVGVSKATLFIVCKYLRESSSRELMAQRVEEYWNYYNRQFMTDRTWVKALSAWMHKTYGTNIKPDVLAAIGAIVSRNTVQEDMSVYFEIVDRPNWSDGGFGDAGSCWWSQYRDTRDGLFLSRKGFALKFYSNEKQRDQYHGRRGQGRCWMYYENGHFYIFNARGLTIQTMAIALNRTFGGTFSNCALTCEGAAYVDGQGYTIGPEPLPSKFKMKFMEEAYGSI